MFLDRVADRFGSHGIEALSCRYPISYELYAEEALATALARFASDPASELKELVLRDVLDVALGNTDNHARNTAVVKSNTIELTPLFDFCPMFLDPRGVARVCRWADGGQYPDWSRVADFVGTLGVDVRKTKRFLRELADRIGELPRIMKSCHVPALVIDGCKERVARVARDLAAVKA